MSESLHIDTRKPAADASTPLCVDLDGTLIRSDLLWESVARVVKQQPWVLPFLPIWLLKGKAYLKRGLTERVALDVALLPYNLALLEYLRAEKARGRPLYLVTASDERFARQVAAHCGIFDDVVGSDGAVNLRGAQKAEALVARFGERGFDYAGDSHVDLAVWAHARQAIVVGRAGMVRAAQAKAPVAAEFSPGTRTLRALAKLVRPHQWVKNLIVFVPLLTSHQLTRAVPLKLACLAFASFCLCASGVYVVNDLLDIDADRRHASKRARPLASGDLPLLTAFVLTPVLFAGGAATAISISPAFGAVILVYSALSFAYSWRLKRTPLVDVFVLAGLYTLRLIGGHVAAGVEFSDWLLAFSMFIFLSLALVKRYQEVQRLRGVAGGAVAGRGYMVADLELLTPLGAASGYLAVLVMALYVSSENVRLLYHRPILLLLICPLLLYWISRTWLYAHRGWMNDDPVVFALKDRQSYLVGLLTLLIIWAAT